jgi:hypothetical protein
MFYGATGKRMRVVANIWTWEFLAQPAVCTADLLIYAFLIGIGLYRTYTIPVQGLFIIILYW